ncbi:DPP IV N-terminal domain-containing protein [Wandonia haliotis]|uniref:DPP IV N-terminal domain-containing protein n=1 Tax=Wandonia haliotis TaxID=574963 RepID=A0ABN1MSB3_9FLAO
MKAIFFLILTLVTLPVLFAQKELTLEDAVMNQYRGYYPEHVFGFNWLPESSDYAYLDGYVNMVIVSGKGKTERISIKEVSKVTGEDIMWFSGLQWKDASSFYIADNNKYFLYNYKTGEGEKTLEFDALAENGELEIVTGAVAYTIDNNLYVATPSGKQIPVTANEDKNIVSGQAIARSEFGITDGIFWSPKGNYLAFYQKDETNVAEYPMLDITKTPGETSFIKYPMTGQKSEHGRVGVYNMTTGKTIYIEPKGAKEDYLTNLSWTPDEKHVLIAEVNRGQNHMQLQMYNAESGAFVKTILEEKHDKWVEPEHPAFFFNQSADEFVWMSEKDGFMNLYLCSVEKGFVRQLTHNTWEALGILGTNAKGTEVYFEGTGESPLEMRAFAVQVSSGKQTELTPGEGTHSVTVSYDGAHVFDQYSSTTIPNIARILNRKGKTVKTLVEAENKMKDLVLGQAEISTLKAKDGTELYTRLIKPSDFDPNKKYPVLVYVYGGPHAQLITNSWFGGASLWMYWMAEQGYLVYTLDNRGSAHRGFAFENVIHRQLGTIEIEDQLTGVAYLKSLPFVDGNRMAVHGWSFGGFMTSSLMLREPGVFTTGVAGGPVTDWKYYEVMYGERYMDRPDENEAGYEAASLLNKTENLEGKLLLIHGSIDDVVVMQHSHSLIKSFIDKGKQVDFFVYPMHEHNVRGKDRVHLMQKVLTYILENNK